MFLTSSGYPTISAIPPALSDTGPYASIAKPIVNVDSIPNALNATPNIDNNEYDINDVNANKNTGTIVDKFPNAIPYIIFVAAPVPHAYATS